MVQHTSADLASDVREQLVALVSYYENIITQEHDKANLEHRKPKSEAELISKHEVMAKIDAIIYEAFQKSAEKNRKELYKKIAIFTHPDKERCKDNKLLFDFLGKNHLQLKNFLSITNQKYLSLKYRRSNVLLRGWGFIENKCRLLFSHHNRYLQPFLTIVRVAIFITSLCLFSLSIPLLMPIGFLFLVTTLIETLHKKLLDKLAGDFYRIETVKYNQLADINTYLDSKEIFIGQKRRYFIGRSWPSLQEAFVFYTMSDDELIQEIIAARIQEQWGVMTTCDAVLQSIEDDIKSSMASNASGFTKIRLLVQALINLLNEPLRQNNEESLSRAVFRRIIQSLGAIVLLISSLVIQSSWLGQKLLFASVLATSAILESTALIILNMPLYLLDGISFIINCGSNTASNLEQNTADSHNISYLSMLISGIFEPNYQKQPPYLAIEAAPISDKWLNSSSSNDSKIVALESTPDLSSSSSFSCPSSKSY